MQIIGNVRARTCAFVCVSVCLCACGMRGIMVVVVVVGGGGGRYEDGGQGDPARRHEL